MKTGKIKKIIHTYGFIIPDEGGDDLFFHASVVRGVDFDDLEEGLEVEYETRMGKKGIEAACVQITDKQSHEVKVGKIKNLIEKKGYGFIVPDEGGEDIFFHSSDLYGSSSFDGLEEGLEVMYKAEMGDRGMQATRVEVPEYRFLNPYNFVRTLDLDSNQKERSKDVKLLGRCHPPPHDRYIGLSGKITCEVEAVTPLFISDSEDIQVENKHKSFRFFQLDGEHALPSTSLRGMIRSVFEAATNSCFAIFKGDRLSYRIEPTDASKCIPARVERKNKGGFYLRLLPGTEKVQINKSRVYAAWVPRYSSKKSVSLNGLENGDECAAIIRRRKGHWEVVELAENKTELSSIQSGNTVVEKGWLCITNKNIENKNNERYFFRSSNNRSMEQTIPIDQTVVDDYNKMVDECQERHQDDVKERRQNGTLDEFIDENSPAFSPFIYQGTKAHLSDGDLVYARLSATSKGKLKVDYIIPVAIGRVLYENSIGDLLIPSSLHACEKYEELCPACRMFGWVKDAYKDESDTDDSNILAAYKGRVVFTHGKLLKSAGQLPPTTLAILSSPNPTTTRFYLMPQDGKPKDGLTDKKAGYDGNNKLRGRKFYRHHGEANPTEYEREGNINDHQNRTVRDALKPEAKFEFTIEFTNLAPVELGALLWTLELDGKGYHRLGYAKPLGFGSIKLKVNELSVLKTAQRYRSLKNSGWKAVNRTSWHTWVELFKQAMTEKYDKQSFAELPNIQDMFALLSKPQTDFPIHYPRTTRSPRKEGKNFEWFVGNNRNKKQRLALKLAVDDNDGLPLLDKDGKKV